MDDSLKNITIAASIHEISHWFCLVCFGLCGKSEKHEGNAPPSSFMPPPLLKLGPQIFRPVGLYLLTRKQAMTLGYSLEHQTQRKMQHDQSHGQRRESKIKCQLPSDLEFSILKFQITLIYHTDEQFFPRNNYCSLIAELYLQCCNTNDSQLMKPSSKFYSVSYGTGETELTLHRIPLMHNAFFLLIFCAEWDRYNISVKKKNGIFRHLPKG